MVTIKMINFKEVLAMIGITPQHPNAKEVKTKLTKYNNPFSATKTYKQNEVEELIGAFEPVGVVEC